MRCDIQLLSGKSRQICLAGCAVLGLPGLASGQLEDRPIEEQEAVNRYTVELIVFEYTNPALAGNEQFLPDELSVDEDSQSMAPRTFGDPGSFAEPEMSVAVEDELNGDGDADYPYSGEPGANEKLEELPSHIIQTQLEVLDPDVHAMKDIYDKLATNGAYRPIMRAAWTQVTHEKDQTLPIRLRRLGNAPLRLDGTVMLYLSRYLHLVVDLSVEAEDEQTANRYDDPPFYGDRRRSTRYSFGYQQRSAPIKYRISEDRIFRNGELRYYDHPKFGVLARVTRVEQEAPETDEMFLLPPENAGAQ